MGRIVYPFFLGGGYVNRILYRLHLVPFLFLTFFAFMAFVVVLRATKG